MFLIVLTNGIIKIYCIRCIIKKLIIFNACNVYIEKQRNHLFNIQPTADTDNVFPLIAPGLPKKYEKMELGKEDVERLGQNKDHP